MTIYEYFKDFQSIIGYAVGFLGIVLTLIFNNIKDRRFHKWKTSLEQKSIASGFIAELSIISDSLHTNIQICKDYQDGGSLFIPKNSFQITFYLSSIDKIILLPAEHAKIVVRAYAMIKDFPNLLLIVAKHKNGEIPPLEDRGTFYVLRGSSPVRRFCTVLESVVDDTDIALKYLNKIL